MWSRKGANISLVDFAICVGKARSLLLKQARKCASLDAVCLQHLRLYVASCKPRCMMTLRTPKTASTELSEATCSASSLEVEELFA